MGVQTRPSAATGPLLRGTAFTSARIWWLPTSSMFPYLEIYQLSSDVMQQQQPSPQPYGGYPPPQNSGPPGQYPGQRPGMSSHLNASLVHVWTV